jgi:pimeloyl-ACP methyl ester carboxylesterase
MQRLILCLTTSLLVAASSLTTMPKTDWGRVKGNAKRGNIDKLPFHHPNNNGRSGYYFIPHDAPKDGIPVLVLFHGFKDNGNTLVQTFKQFAEKYKFALVSPDAEGHRWKVPKKGKYTSDMIHARDALAWISKHIGKIDQKHIGAFGHSYGSRMSAAFGTNMPVVTKTAISHGRFVEDSLGGSKTKFWMSGSPKDNQFDYKVMPRQKNWYNRTFRKWWGGATLHTYACDSCYHFPSHDELNDFVHWFLK